ncbi:biotin--[acetyl-CoA-carboxylase] ligase [Anaeroglobus geminatus]|uniref:Bifunctional ligase/repressor BirA n=1 Tax=Anaeroglobus geminatus F0357 TaxID=861450 RepID=G9YGV5_9FIRM|nr:biotin--[acetyl-CoA-carboxylase] ligase [Anaeroglobus geminatus]EHM41653.1 biotin--[acetyl-CoA-carboxylase] ligase [Anaeroglobus geminatus F0357]
MRQDILEYLLEHRGEFVSGQKLSDVLGITRTAVWKHICTLREKGYVVESFTKKGYRLTGVPELLDADAVSVSLHTKSIGRTIVYRERADSTNTLAKELADKGAVEGTVVTAEEQSGGKGRLERSFYSPYAKGLWFSVILRPPFPPIEVSKITLLAAVAVTRTLHRFGLAGCVIKWPNDLLVNGRKIVGILTELSATMEQVGYVVLGIGINTTVTLDEMPEEIRAGATSFAAEGIIVSRNELWRAVMESLEKYYEKAKKEGFSSILDEWRILSSTLGKTVEVTLPRETLIGRAVDIDGDGNLLVMSEKGMERVVAGDVRVRTK